MRAVLDSIGPLINAHPPRNYYSLFAQATDNSPSSHPKMIELSQRSDFLEKADLACKAYEKYVESAKASCQKLYPELQGKQIAYFSMEYGFDTLPIYSGGLGILSGDHLRGASDLGIPLVAVGLLYLEGYYEQNVDLEGHMRVSYESLVPPGKDVKNYLPLESVQSLLEKTPLIVEVPIGNRTVKAQVWVAKIGRVDLLLLDTNLQENDVNDRSISQRLYASKKPREDERQRRLEQEMILGVGGVKALYKAGYHPDAFHLNEGHAAFACFEILRHVMSSQKLAMDSALKSVCHKIGFTTHTPVPEGNERFDFNLVVSQLKSYLDTFLDIKESTKLLAWGKNTGNLFDMTQLALLFSGAFRNGVSQLHGDICQTMWAHLAELPNKPVNPLPIGAITNAIHIPYWQQPSLARMLDEFGGVEKILEIPGQTLWSLHQQLKQQMLDAVKSRMTTCWKREGLLPDDISLRVNKFPSKDSLMIGFARRFAAYKRVTLILDDEEYLFEFLERMYQKYKTPISLLFAGKPHPDNYPGRNRIHQIWDVSRRLEEYCLKKGIEASVYFIEGYDIELARYLESGCDLWLNNPTRPLEASGTSGMKAGINGVLNLSINDGWVPEGIRHGLNGWIFGKGGEDTTNNEDREELFRVLEKEVFPVFFSRPLKANTFSPEWVKMMMSSISSIMQFFNTERMLREYIEKMYLPAIRAKF